MTRAVNLVVIHCSASPNGRSLWEGDARDRTLRTPAEVIDRWHAARGFHRTAEWRQLVNPRLEAIGYHFVVDLNGAIESGRHLDEVGAHVSNHNLKSVGICMVGTDRFSLRQWDALKTLVNAMALKYPGARICGHRDLSPDVDGDGLVEPWEWLKTCPGFEVEPWIARGHAPLLENILQEHVKES